MTEKYQWVEKYLGKSAVSQLMLTKDKTIVHGDILIDDKPMIKDSISHISTSLGPRVKFVSISI